MTLHGFQWFTIHGVAHLLPFVIAVPQRQGAGGFSSTVVILMLNWLNDMLNTNKFRCLIKAAVLPFWVPFSLSMNMLGLLLDRVDGTSK